MNSPSPTLICNPQIEWSELPYICLFSAFPRLFAPPLFEVPASRPHEFLYSKLFVPRHIESDEGLFGKSTPLFLWVCTFDREKNAKSRKGKKEREKAHKLNSQNSSLRFSASC